MFAVDISAQTKSFENIKKSLRKGKQARTEQNRPKQSNENKNSTKNELKKNKGMNNRIISGSFCKRKR